MSDEIKLGLAIGILLMIFLYEIVFPVTAHVVTIARARRRRRGRAA